MSYIEFVSFTVYSIVVEGVLPGKKMHKTKILLGKVFRTVRIINSVVSTYGTLNLRI